MKIKTITYQRVKNLGNYESERLELTAEVSEDDDVLMTVEALMNMVCYHLGLQHSYHEDKKGNKLFVTKVGDIPKKEFSDEELKDIPW